MISLSQFFSTDDFARIGVAVRQAELVTSGEIVVRTMLDCDEELRSVIDPATRVYRQALQEFDKHGLKNTRDKTGILVLLVVGERRFQILADSGINEKFSQGEWNLLAAEAAKHFRDDKHADGVCFLVGEIGKKLAEFFPRRPDDKNELPDSVIAGGGR